MYFCDLLGQERCKASEVINPKAIMRMAKGRYQLACYHRPPTRNVNTAMMGDSRGIWLWDGAGGLSLSNVLFVVCFCLS